jgi:hypothetical protein
MQTLHVGAVTLQNLELSGVVSAPGCEKFQIWIDGDPGRAGSSGRPFEDGKHHELSIKYRLIIDINNH